MTQLETLLYILGCQERISAKKQGIKFLFMIPTISGSFILLTAQ
jgi:hypothetical protein